MEDCVRGVRSGMGNGTAHPRSRNNEAGKLLYPAFRAPYLFCGFSYCSLVPAAPISLYVAGVGELAVLVTENDDVIFENNEKICRPLFRRLCSRTVLDRDRFRGSSRGTGTIVCNNSPKYRSDVVMPTAGSMGGGSAISASKQSTVAASGTPRSLPQSRALQDSTRRGRPVADRN